MTSPTVVPCTAWTPIGCTSIDPSGAAVSGTMLGVAQEILYQLTGGQFDQCTLTLRPCRETCFGDAWPSDRWNRWGTQWPYPYWYDGQWFNLGCGGCPGTCSCDVIHEILLPYPVAEVTDVTIDGVTLSPLEDHVMLYDHRRLLRIDGEAWPLCNDFSKADGEVGTWTVTFITGTPVPPLGQLALGELTTELVAACVGAACRLPSNVQQIVRQGVTQTKFDPNVMFAERRLGLFYSDLFISTYNPPGIRDRARAIDVDRRGPRYQT